MGKSISLDVAALTLLTILLVSCIFRKMTSGISNRIFLIIILIAITATVFDINAVTLDNAHSNNISALYTAHVGYLITHYLSAPLHLLFVISLTDTWHKLKKNIALQIVLALPLAVVFAVFVANADNYLMFSVENGYTRGPLFSLMYVTTILYVIYDIAFIIRHRKLFDIGKIITISAVIPLSMAAMIIQMLFPTALVEMFCSALSLLIVSIGIQRPEDYIDSFTQLMKYSAYAHDNGRYRMVFYESR